MLKYRCTSAARLAFLLAPIPEIMAVTQVPIFCPMMMGMALPKLTAPVAQRACRIPTDAEELWMMAVRTAPAIIPRIGLENIVRSPVNSGTSARGFTASLMVSIPNIRMAKPIIMVPRFFFFSFFVNMMKIMPISARTGEKDDGFNSCTKKFPLSIPVRLKSQDVTVVPMLAPMMMPTAWVSFIIPEFTKPTTITVVAEDDWITAVTPAPRSTALMGLDVSFSRIRSRRPPDSFSSPWPMVSIPYRNSARPPIIDKSPKKSIPSSVKYT